MIRFLLLALLVAAAQVPAAAADTSDTPVGSPASAAVDAPVAPVTADATTEQADPDCGCILDDNASPTEIALPWWGWSLILLVSCFLLGIIATLGGVGGGVLFVPIVGSFFPFHMDFVRCTGLLVALTGALSAGPRNIRNGLASFKLAIPGALLASTFAIMGALCGLVLPQWAVKSLLGLTILGISAILIKAKRSEYPQVTTQDAFGMKLGIQGSYFEPTSGEEVKWKTHRTLTGMLTFIAIGFIAGMFGLGAGWANIPVLNLVMGAPLKVSAATSQFILSITDTSAAWVYVNKGTMVPLIALPALVGMFFGARLGAILLPKTKPKIVRIFVIILLLAAGARSLWSGIDGWLSQPESPTTTEEAQS